MRPARSSAKAKAASSGEANYERALQLNPDDFSAHLGYAHMLSITSRHEEALREVNRALAILQWSRYAATSHNGSDHEVS